MEMEESEKLVGQLGKSFGHWWETGGALRTPVWIKVFFSLRVVAVLAFLDSFGCCCCTET